MMKLIERPFYLNQLKRVKGVPDIKVITGIRRCGKSKLMASYAEYIRKVDLNANIINIDYSDIEFEELKHYQTLNSYVEEHYCSSKNNYLFIDEVQMCEGFELVE